MKINIDELTNLLSHEDIYTQRSELSKFQIFDKLPSVAVYPQTYEQVSEILKYCNENGYSVLPFGSCTKVSYGNMPTSFDIALSLEKLNKIIKHNEADFIITVQAGAKFKDIQDFLLSKNQFVGLDPPLIDKGATIGGIVATNDYGPSRFRYGTFREQIIELVAVGTDGKIFKGGAKVVKNVAGYDIHKLFVGSMGTLGVVVEASIKLYPVQEKSLTFITGISDTVMLKSCINKILDADLVLTAFEILNPELSSDVFKLAGIRPINFLHTLVLRIENVRKAVFDQMELVKNILNSDGLEGAVIENDNPLWSYLRNFPYAGDSNCIACKVSVKINKIPKILEYIKESSENLNIKIFSSAKAGNGIIQLLIEGENKDLEIAVDLLRSYLTTLKGSVVYQHIPGDFGKFNTWGEFGSSSQLMQILKQNFDPNNILNPGRLI